MKELIDGIIKADNEIFKLYRTIMNIIDLEADLKHYDQTFDYISFHNICKEIQSKIGIKIVKLLHEYEEKNKFKI